MGIYNANGDSVSEIYNSSGIRISKAYDIDGVLIYSETPVDYDEYTIESLLNINVANCQGIAVHNNVLFQFRGSSSVSDRVCLFDLSDGSTIISNMVIESDHGDSATFSNEFYGENDEFPLIYVTADTSPAKIYVNRISRSESTLIKTLIFPSTAGYYGAGAFDWDNNVCYLLAYKQNNYLSDNSGANTTVITQWDLTQLTDNGDGTFTPSLIAQYERPFIYCMQGLAYHDGMIWIASGYNTGGSQYIYAIDPSDGTVKHTILLNNTTEIEGVDFVYNDGQYYMFVGQQGGKYSKITFG